MINLFKYQKEGQYLEQMPEGVGMENNFGKKIIK